LESFSQKTIEDIKCYVYCLFDPRTSKIFYIGEGTGNRIFNHITCALDNPEENDKINTIRDIINQNLKVGHYIIRHGLTREIALLVESCLIDFLTFHTFKELSNITNIIAGHYAWDKGIKTVDEIEALYSAETLNKNGIKHKVIIININKTYLPGISPYEATRKSWKMDIDRARKSDFIFSEYKSIIRKIYIPEKWFFTEDNKRCFFEGKECQDKEILNLYLNKQLSDKKQGQANPIQYVNL